MKTWLRKWMNFTGLKQHNKHHCHQHHHCLHRLFPLPIRLCYLKYSLHLVYLLLVFRLAQLHVGSNRSRLLLQSISIQATILLTITASSLTTGSIIIQIFEGYALPLLELAPLFSIKYSWYRMSLAWRILYVYSCLFSLIWFLRLVYTNSSDCQIT